MKYKVGDKVRIKTWDQMESEYGVDMGQIHCRYRYTTLMEEKVQAMNLDRIVVIKSVKDNIVGDSKLYCINGISWNWSDDMIECLVKEMYIILEPIESRFELMEL